MRPSTAILPALLIAACGSAFATGSPAAPAQKETLPSGVVVEHLKPGSGASPGPTDMVRVHYRGTLSDGSEFDSSHRRGEPATFPLNRVIPCWTQGLQRMKVGGTARLSCPSDTAYGSRGAGGVIPPNAKLDFEVELLDIRR